MRTPPKPIEPQGLVGKITPYLFRGLDLSNLLVHRGELLYYRRRPFSHYYDLDLKANLTFLNWGQPAAKVEVNIANWESPPPRAGRSWRPR